MRSILSSAERVVLECGACEERTVLGGPTEVWLSGPAGFECEGCGRTLTLADKLDAQGPGAERGGIAKAGPGTHEEYRRLEEPKNARESKPNG